MKNCYLFPFTFEIFLNFYVTCKKNILKNKCVKQKCVSSFMCPSASLPLQAQGLVVLEWEAQDEPLWILSLIPSSFVDFTAGLGLGLYSFLQCSKSTGISRCVMILFHLIPKKHVEEFQREPVIVSSCSIFELRSIYLSIPKIS